MKKLFLTFFLSLSLFLSAQNFENLNFGTDSTLEIITWNLESFPKNGQTTINYVKQIIEALNVDIIAIQELDNTESFQQLVNSLDGYEGMYGSENYVRLAYIYNSNVVHVNDFFEIYVSYWRPFPRPPVVMDFTFNEERYILINNHLKCCGDGVLNLNDADDEENRRYVACNLLKSYVDENFPENNVLLVGDWNDELNIETQNNVFQAFLNDNAHYLFTDYEIAFGNSSDWSYPSWPSHLDHILITNELFDDFEQEHSAVAVLKVDECFSNWWQYDQFVSDHRPVALRLLPNSNVSINETADNQPIIYPNPFRHETTFDFKGNYIKEITITNSVGQIVHYEHVSNEENVFRWHPDKINGGIYFAKFLLKNNEIIVKKLILVR